MLSLGLMIHLVAPESAWCQIGELDAEFAGAGARPLSMGGAFIGLADDSTAAEFNPAGIRILPRPELAWQVTRTYDRREELLWNASEEQDLVLFTNDENQWTTPSFISCVYPTEKVTFALSQLTTIDFVHRYDDPTPSFSGNPFYTKSTARNNAFGLTLAFDIKPRLHLGVTMRMNRYDFRNRTPSLYNNPSELTDWSPNLNVGLLWRATKDWSFGAVFKSSQKVEGEFDNNTVIDTKLPETAGIGVAYHPNDRVRLLADVDYINWSEFDGAPNDQFRRNDVTRFHLGGEYLLDVDDDRAWFLRGGYMREESNSMYYNGVPGESFDEFFEEAFPEKDDIDHLTLGLGLAKEKFQLDLAVDHSIDGGTVLIVAMIHYF